MVILIKQSFKEYIESNIMISVSLKKNLPNLELISMVYGSGYGNTFTSHAIEEVNNMIIEKAKKLGASHVFGIEYGTLIASEYSNIGIIGYGDAYKTKE